MGSKSFQAGEHIKVLRVDTLGESMEIILHPFLLLYFALRISFIVFFLVVSL